MARVIGVSPETVRLWERSGKSPEGKTAGGGRWSNSGDVECGERVSDNLLVESKYGKKKKKKKKPLFEYLFHRRVKLEAWREFFSPQLYEEWFRENDIDMRRYLGGRETGTSLPWEFIDIGIDQTFLEKEFGKADHADKTVDCLSGCARCGLECHEGQVTGHTAQGTDIKQNDGSEKQDPPQRHRRAGKKSREEIEVTGHKSQGTSIEKQEGSESVKEDIEEKKQGTSLKKEEGKRFTFRYIKRSDARYIGHIDTMNIILRAIRASGIEIIMHRKYHPMPKIALSDALPIGIESTCELIEIEAAQGTVIDQRTLEAINRGMPGGMKMREFIEGSLKDMVKEYLYVLVSETDVGNEFEQWKQKGRKYFYIWRDSRVKNVWMRGVFQRIIKIETRRIYGI